MLRDLNYHNIPAFEVRTTGPISVSLYIHCDQLECVKQITQKRNAELRILALPVKDQSTKKILRRPVLLLLCLCTAALTIVLSNRVLFLNVEGNNEMPTKYILEHAADCGVFFGVPKDKIDTDQFQTKLLSQLPELSWAGVQTFGSSATIQIIEKEKSENSRSEQGKVENIIAATDGVITSCTVYKGTPLCQIGQSVKTGQKLISGFTDCGIVTQTTRAQGEVIADTFHTITAVTPDNYHKRGESTHYECVTYIQIGKKLIKLFKPTGISNATCVKMYEKRYASLPGGWQLPIAIIREHCYYHPLTSLKVNEQEAKAAFEENIKHYLSSIMTAGRIVHAEETITRLDDSYQLLGKYNCRESIGVASDEECFCYHGKNY